MPKTIIHQAVRKSSGKPHADQFRAMDVWRSPRGEQLIVTRVSTSGIAYMVNKATQRHMLRAYNDLGWGADRPWVRVFSGTEGKS